MINYESKIKTPNGVTAPDNYDDSLGLIPQDDFVVTRNRDGSIASRYGDMIWDLSSYDPDCRSKLFRFPFWNNLHLTPERAHLNRESRWLMFILIWKHEQSLSIGSLDHYLGLIRVMAKFSEKNACQIKDILTDSKILMRFVDSVTSGGNIVILSCLLSTLLRLGVEQTGLEVAGRSVRKELNKRMAEYDLKTKQYPPIPTRIYSGIISGLTLQLEDFEAVAARYLALVQLCASNPLIGRSKGHQCLIAGKLNSDLPERSPEFNDLLFKYNLHGYFSKKELIPNVRGLSTGLAIVQKFIKLIVQTYSGMRSAEALSLPYHCTETSTSDGQCHYLILGRTTKLNGGKFKRVRWVTNSEGHRAINVAKLIADTIYKTLGEKPLKSLSRVNTYPLFVAPTYLPFSGDIVPKKDDGYLSALLTLGSLSAFEKIKAHFMPNIENCDLQELEQIDPHRAWRTEPKFNIGSPWPMTSHQLRRSLALYAQRSGLVSLPSLRRQLQHLTEEMSRYYARGSSFARNFINDYKEHFGLEWQETGPISAAMSYTHNVLFSDEVLFGGHNDWIKKHLCGPDGTLIVNREETLRRFKMGEFSYRETFLGGCTNTGECKQTALNWLDIDCLVGCSNLVGSLPKLERIIKAQTRLVSLLDPNSIEFRTEKADLNVLITTHNKVLGLKKEKMEVACNLNF